MFSLKSSVVGLALLELIVKLVPSTIPKIQIHPSSWCKELQCIINVCYLHNHNLILFSHFFAEVWSVAGVTFSEKSIVSAY